MRGIDEIDLQSLTEMIREAAKTADISDDPHGWMVKWIRQIVDRSYELDGCLTERAQKNALTVAMLAAVAEAEGYSAAANELAIEECPYPDQGLIADIDPLSPFKAAYWRAGWYANNNGKAKDDPKFIGHLSQTSSPHPLIRRPVRQTRQFESTVTRVKAQFPSFDQALELTITRICNVGEQTSRQAAKLEGKYQEYAQDFLPGYEVIWSRQDETITLESLRITSQPNLF